MHRHEPVALYHVNLYSVPERLECVRTVAPVEHDARLLRPKTAGAAGAAQETQARSLCVFDATYFSRLLQEALRRAPAPSYDEVYELAKLCSVRLSFVKGWGAEYHRQVRHLTYCHCLSHAIHILVWEHASLFSS